VLVVDECSSAPEAGVRLQVVRLLRKAFDRQRVAPA
jgi:ABC-type microcin C transport system duplicated ATPase subunit YejF